MWEDLFEVYRFIVSDGKFEPAQQLAGNMSLADATLFCKAWMEESYADQISALLIKRQAIRAEDKPCPHWFPDECFCNHLGVNFIPNGENK